MTGTPKTVIYYFSERTSFSPEGDFSRLEIFEPFDAILCGKYTSKPAIERLISEFPDKHIGLYYMCAFELSPEEQATYPGPLSNRTTGVGTVVGEMNDATVEWHAERARQIIGSAHSLMSDNSDPTQPIGDPSLYGDEEVANWREWVPKTMAAIKAAIGNAELVANVGHDCNPVTQPDGPIRDCYLKFCPSLNGIGIEMEGGEDPFAFWTPASFQGPYRSPRLSWGFTRDAEAWTKAKAMKLPQGVHAGCPKHVWLEEQGIV